MKRNWNYNALTERTERGSSIDLSFQVIFRALSKDIERRSFPRRCGTRGP